MNKKAIILICVLIFLAILQPACAFTDSISGGETSQALIGGKDHSQRPASKSEDGSSAGEAGEPADPSPENCVPAFSGSTNLSDGQSFAAGESILAEITLTNSGSCPWNPLYQLVMIDGGLLPVSGELEISQNVAPGESILVNAEFSAPAQEGTYISLWKMRDSTGGLFGQTNPNDAPLRIKVRVLPSSEPQPTPSPTPAATPNELTLLEGECFDFNAGSVVDCSDSSADFWYNVVPVVGGQLYKGNDSIFGTYHQDQPDLNVCQNDSYAPLPHPVQDGEYLSFRIETIASTTYGWIRVDDHNQNGLSFDYAILPSAPPLVSAASIASPFVETGGEQITVLEGECYDVWGGETNSSCSGIFAGFRFEEVTKKSLQVSQIEPQELSFSAVLNSQPSKSDCESASYSTTPIWPIHETGYYCYQFVPGTTAHYGWLRPTSFNLNGMTFDYLTWEASP